ncbi:hypothetical protein Barb6_02900 [Bacteroidales bacterium Barb6]|nr:hypothetical protein Barb6_02900 [Bacteroidales bacterium Barb6]
MGSYSSTDVAFPEFAALQDSFIGLIGYTITPADLDKLITDSLASAKFVITENEANADDLDTKIKSFLNGVPALVANNYQIKDLSIAAGKVNVPVKVTTGNFTKDSTTISIDIVPAVSLEKEAVVTTSFIQANNLGQSALQDAFEKAITVALKSSPDESLTIDEDYEVKSLVVAKDSASVSAIIKGIGNYKDSVTVTVTVTDFVVGGGTGLKDSPIQVSFTKDVKRDLTKADFGDNKYYVIDLKDATGLTGIAIDAFGPNVTLTGAIGLSSATSLRGADGAKSLFTAYVENNGDINKGEYKAIASDNDSIVITNYYAAKRQEPVVTFSRKVGKTVDDSPILEKQTATVSWKNGSLKDADTYKPEVDMKEFAGVNRFFSELISFEITPFPLENQLIFTPKKELVYNGQKKELISDEFTLTTKKDIHPIVLTPGDYNEKIEYKNNVNAGEKATATFTITNPNFALSTPAKVFEPFTITVPFTIEKAEIDDAEIRIIQKKADKDGKVTLVGSDVVSKFGKFGTDFTFENGKTTVSVLKANKKEVKIALDDKKSNLKLEEGETFIIVSFGVVEKSVNDLASKAVVTDNKPTFTGSALRPTVKIANLAEGTDFNVVLYEGKSVGDDITGKNSLEGTEAGDYVIWVEGIGEYGEHAAAGTFKINKANVATDVQWHTPAFTGYETPEELLDVLNGELKVGDHKLKYNTDYAVVLSPSTDGVFYSALVTGAGDNFTGTHTLTFNEDSKIETVTSVPTSVSYANGVLTLTNLNGATATVVSLNGKIAAKFTVSGNEAQKSVSLAPGFYILNAGNAATKFIVK